MCGVFFIWKVCASTSSVLSVDEPWKISLLIRDTIFKVFFSILKKLFSLQKNCSRFLFSKETYFSMSSFFFSKDMNCWRSSFRRWSEEFCLFRLKDFLFKENLWKLFDQQTTCGGSLEDLWNVFFIYGGLSRPNRSAIFILRPQIEESHIKGKIITSLPFMANFWRMLYTQGHVDGEDIGVISIKQSCFNLVNSSVHLFVSVWVIS